MNLDLLQTHITEGNVRVQQHPALPLRILNYSAECQYARRWDDVTLQCRGLVMHGNDIIARPFRKFFNDTEHAEGEIPWHLTSRITEKLDGSLLIWFCFDGEWIAATRGSFTSEQSAVGRELILRRYSLDDFDESCTYLFECIYPENRIVVNYGDRREVVLLAIVETATGMEVEPDTDVFHAVKSLPPTACPRSLRELIRDDEEGYVVRFENNFRVKVKGARYIQLHKVISGISTRMIWEHLSAGASFSEVLEIVPDECAEWVAAERDKLIAQYDAIHLRALDAVSAAKSLPTRKEQALRILAEYSDVSAIAFSMLDGKDHARPLWRQIYPDYARPAAALRLEA